MKRDKWYDIPKHKQKSFNDLMKGVSNGIKYEITSTEKQEDTKRWNKTKKDYTWCWYVTAKYAGKDFPKLNFGNDVRFVYEVNHEDKIIRRKII